MPNLIFADLVRETTTATGVSSLALAGAVPGHRSFADAVPAGARFHYSIAGVTHEHEWEVGEGEIVDGALANRVVLASCVGPAPVDFSPGLKIVTLTVAAEWFAARDDRAGHDHGIADVTGLQAALDGKQAAASYASAEHGHAVADVTGLQAALDGKQTAGNYAAASHSHARLLVEPGSADSPAVSLSGDSDTGVFTPGADTIAIATAGMERARFTADGRLGVGTPSPLSAVHVLWDGFNPNANLNGAMMVGGPFGGGMLFKDGIATSGLWTSDFGYSLHIGMGTAGLTAALEVRQDELLPGTDAAVSLGKPGCRWTQLYAVDGTINTSDARDKHWIGTLSLAERAAGHAILNELGLFQWFAAREAKGADAARLHFGIRAQNAFDILSAHGLDWRRYGWCCQDQWEDDDGLHDRFGVRPDQLALFLIAVLARQVADLSAALSQVPDAGA